MKGSKLLKRKNLIEMAKTVVIVLLSLSCVFSGVAVYRIYREQTLTANKTSVAYSSYAQDKTSQTALAEFWSVSKPEMILINKVGIHKNIKENTANFDGASEIISSVMREVFLSPAGNFAAVDEKEWRTSLKNNSLYVKYPVSRLTEVEADFYEKADNPLMGMVDSYRDMIIVPDEDNSKKMTVYVHDTDSEGFARLDFESALAKSVKDILRTENENLGSKWSFAYESGLDKSFGLLNPMMIVPTEKIMANRINISVPKLYESGLNISKTTEFSDGLINVFGYNPNTVRQYSGSNNALIIVAETGSLSIHPGGTIEYKALTANDGVKFAETGTNSMYDVNSGICSIMNQVFYLSGVMPEDGDFDIRMTVMREDSDEERLEIGYDYFIHGNKVAFPEKTAVYAVVEKGALTEFGMQVREIEIAGEKAQMPSLTDAIKEYKSVNPSIKDIVDIRRAYVITQEIEDVPLGWEVEGVK